MEKNNTKEIFIQYEDSLNRLKPLKKAKEELEYKIQKEEENNEEIIKLIKFLSNFTIAEIGEILAQVATEVTGIKHTLQKILLTNDPKLTSSYAIAKEDIVVIAAIDKEIYQGSPIFKQGYLLILDQDNPNTSIEFYKKFTNTPFEYLNDFIKSFNRG